MKILKKSIMVLMCIGMFGMVAAGCGGGGGGGGSTPQTATATISGTAAAGAPMIGTVTIKDSSSPEKTKTVTIAANGSYTVDVSDLTAPFVFRADGSVGGNHYSLCSAATQADVNGTINITPLTDLIVANIAGTLANNYFNNGNYSMLTPSQLSTQEAALQAALEPTLQALGLSNSIDLLRSSFSADHTGLDAALDVIKVSTDTSTNVATLTNIITQQTITNNISTGAISGTLNNTTGVATGLTAIQAIVSNFNALSQLFATSLPSPTNTQLLALFDSSSFLSDGMDLPSFLSDMTSDPSNIGLSFTNVTIQSINSTQDAAVLSFDVMKSGKFIGSINGWNCIKNGGVWLIQGNMRIALVELQPGTDYSIKSASIMSTGITFRIRDDGGRGITTAQISGPGIAGAITATAAIATNDFFQIPNSFDGILYGMTDTQIGQIPDTGAIYTIELYAGSSLLATYAVPLSHKPYLLAQLAASNYIEITAPTVSTLSSFTSGNLLASWILPNGMAYDGITLGMSDASGFTNFYEASGKPTDTSATLTVQPSSFTPVMRWFWVHGVDNNGVAFHTLLDY